MSLGVTYHEGRIEHHPGDRVEYDLRLVTPRKKSPGVRVRGGTERQNAAGQGNRSSPRPSGNQQGSQGAIVHFQKPRRDCVQWRKARLRRALGRAGVVEGCRHVCRRQGCGHFEAAKDQAQRRCPKDNQKLWVKPVVRPIRFHDQRHTTASLLTQAGANPASVQRMLRHSDPKVTERYRHLSPGYMRAEVDRLHFGLTVEEPPGPALETAQATASGGVVDSVVDHGPRTTKGPHVAVEALVVASELGAGNRIRTGDPQLGNPLHAQSTWCHRFARAGNDWRWL